ncbi:MAG: universal stress protein [Bryobacteraceae bacterium]
MFSLKTILLPVDFSDRSAGVAPYAKAFASQFQSEVVLLHVDPIGRVENTYSLRTQLNALSSSEFSSLDVKRELVAGDPAANIVKFAQAGQVDLIMMPTHGYGPYRKFLLGSVTAKVLHDSDCPVWTSVHVEKIRPTEPVSYRKVACAVDLGPRSQQVLSWAWELASSFGARLLVIHVTKPGESIVAQEWKPDPQVELVRRATEDITTLLNKLKIEGEIAVESGSVTEVAYNWAARSAADILVIGRHAAKGIAGRLHPHAYAIIRESPCPVVSV